MKRFLILVLAFSAGCSKDEGPTFTSPEGAGWAYTTPDGKMAVTFEVVKAGDNFDIVNQTIKINGTLYNAEKEVVAFKANSVQKIRINANDAKAVYPFDIVFTNGTISSDFKTMDFPSATYYYAVGSTNTVNDVQVKRE